MCVRTWCVCVCVCDVCACVRACACMHACVCVGVFGVYKKYHLCGRNCVNC